MMPNKKLAARTVSIFVREDGSIEGMEEARAAICASPGAVKSWAAFFGQCQTIAARNAASETALKKAA